MYSIIIILHTFFVGAIDAIIKGNIVASYPDWASVPWYFKDQYKLYPGFIALIFIFGGLAIAKALKLNQKKFLLMTFIIGLSGLESLLYWLSIKLFSIPQSTWWAKNDSIFSFYPEIAPWLNVFPHINWLTRGGDVTRQGVLMGSLIAIIIIIIINITWKDKDKDKNKKDKIYDNIDKNFEWPQTKDL